MDWVLSTFLIMLGLVVVISLIVIGIYKLTSKNATQDDE